MKAGGDDERKATGPDARILQIPPEAYARASRARFSSAPPTDSHGDALARPRPPSGDRGSGGHDGLIEVALHT